MPLSVVMPAYNEQGAIGAAIADVQQHVFPRVPGAELIVVDDGSRDATGKLIDEAAALDPRVRPVHKQNGGHGPALLTGIDHARGGYVMLIDSDRQIPLDSFEHFWRAAQTADGAFGVRRTRHDPRLRLYLTAVVRWMLRLLLGVRLRDANVPFKIVRRDVLARALPLIPPDTLAPSIFLAVYMRRTRCSIEEIDVSHRERETGLVSIRRWRLLKFCWRAFTQLLVFRRRLAAEGAHVR